MLSMACSALQHTCLLQKVSTKAERTNPEQYISDMTYGLSKPYVRFSEQGNSAARH